MTNKFQKTKEELGVYEMSEYQKLKLKALQGLWEMEAKVHREMFNESIIEQADDLRKGNGRVA